jgi:response regulator RpfG family c-di-GMP phosphodiesterase
MMVAESPRTGSDPSAAIPLLVVDDEASIRNVLARFLRQQGYLVETADSGLSALHSLGRQRFAAMLCDVRMPAMGGLELLPKALALDPDLAVIMITALNDAQTAKDLLSGGAMDYIVKPFEFPVVTDALERALHKRTLNAEQRRFERLIREEVATRTADLEREQAVNRELVVGVAETLINAMEAKDVYLRGHSQRAATLGASIAEVLGLDSDVVERVRLAGRLHDVGMIGIREAVLHKPGPLTAEEYAHVKDHVCIGMEILAPLKHLGVVLEYVHDHHERVDGAGYPRGLAGEDISIGGRILAAADAFDALTSRRAYREPLTPEATIQHLAGTVGGLLDRRVFDAMKRVVEAGHALVFIDELHG